MRQRLDRQAMFAVAAVADEHVRRQVTDIAEGDDLEAAIGLDANPRDAGMADRHLQPRGGDCKRYFVHPLCPDNTGIVRGQSAFFE